MPTDNPTQAPVTLPPHIARLLAGEDDVDGQAVIELHEHVKRVHRRVQEVTDPPLQNLTSACLALAKALLRGGADPKPALTAIRLNLEFLAEVVDRAPEGPLEHQFAYARQAARLGTWRSSGAGGQSPGLQMVSSRRLGEILLSVCALGDEDLALALRMQQVTGKRIGETLLEMGVVTDAQLENALRMQRKK